MKDVYGRRRKYKTNRERYILTGSERKNGRKNKRKMDRATEIKTGLLIGHGQWNWS
jgi:hypothetical protein